MCIQNLIPTISNSLFWLEKNSSTLLNISRGIEKETLRIDKYGNLAKTKHPNIFGTSLTHKWVTTDFSEILLEFITPNNKSISYLISFLKDIHKYFYNNIKDEFMWPLSMPGFIKNSKDIKIAKYGKSNFGKMKTLYRHGLKNRYGSLMQMISGVHYNFSLPVNFWIQWGKYRNLFNIKDIVSYGYLSLIRNYYRFGWIIPYLFGASPTCCESFLQKQKKNLSFIKKNNNKIYLPYATSLRLSDIGYTNNNIKKFNINFNNLSTYIKKIKYAMHTTSKEYTKIGIKNKKGKYLQLNCNILQLENELYTFIRPKRKTKLGELMLDALYKDGIEYIEVRSLDINPFSPIGINEEQIRCLDLLLIWCSIAKSPLIDKKEMISIYKNWNRVISEGRKPKQTIYLKHQNKEETLKKIGKALFYDFKCIAKILDKNQNYKYYQNVCDNLVTVFDNPELTYSAKILKKSIKYGINTIGLILAKKYRSILSKHNFKILTESQFYEEKIKSSFYQKNIENCDFYTFQQYLLIKNFYT